ncbi:hypothetical protein LCGC14_2462270, partial [marine sediment metagenome]
MTITTESSEILYLTPERKARTLAFWEKQKTGPPGDLPDYRIIPLCDQLNKLRGVCTLQSCTGHPVSLPRRPYVVICPGNLWLWLDEAMFWAFIRTAPSFANETCIEDLRVIFCRRSDSQSFDLRPTICIDFWGEEKSVRTFNRSSELIYEHFRG